MSSLKTRASAKLKSSFKWYTRAVKRVRVTTNLSSTSTPRAIPGLTHSKNLELIGPASPSIPRSVHGQNHYTTKAKPFQQSTVLFWFQLKPSKLFSLGLSFLYLFLIISSWMKTDTFPYPPTPTPTPLPTLARQVSHLSILTSHTTRQKLISMPTLTPWSVRHLVQNVMLYR